MTFEIVKPGAPASWSREDREFREAQALRLRAGSEAVRWKRYRRLRELGYTPEGARWEIEQAAAEAEAAPEEEAPAWGITEDNSAPYIPLEIGDQHTAFEWVMLAADLDPNAPWVGIPGETIEDMRARKTRMLALVPEVWRALDRGVKGKRLEPLFWDYYRTRAGDDFPDLTISVFDAEAMAALFKRISRHGGKISAWLAEREQQENGAPPPGADRAEIVPLSRHAPKSVIDRLITEVYDEAAKNNCKAPNIRQLVKPVQNKLAALGLVASGDQIMKMAHARKHAKRRRKPGKTITSERRGA